ncbi:predicted protein [Sclerotinia sclerotiorum 1980 UF-70]|uniref:Uncharacterized protein n=1 Tax=Sclerotinia sclerotiorum (strain ATCC 18683 / 1980 / Ss-1) TaxID=665079 RepID=A7EH73_SCLS1|nr:predicted protein [Sclerotinia sclerotiorum 1980 UF-70]EDO02189.1 predicted protein [Sclerotinia sclerotiorum 1980 UF-70]
MYLYWQKRISQVLPIQATAQHITSRNIHTSTAQYSKLSNNLAHKTKLRAYAVVQGLQSTVGNRALRIHGV